MPERERRNGKGHQPEQEGQRGSAVHTGGGSRENLRVQRKEPTKLKDRVAFE